MHLNNLEELQKMLSVQGNALRTASQIAAKNPFDSPELRAVAKQAAETQAYIRTALAPMREHFRTMEEIQRQLASLSNPELTSLVRQVCDLQYSLCSTARATAKSKITAKTKTTAKSKTCELVDIVSSQQMAEAAKPALAFLRQERPALSREVERILPSADAGTPPRRKQHIRKRMTDKAWNLIVRADVEAARLDRQFYSMSRTGFDYLLTVIPQIGNIVPDNMAHSVNALIFVLMVVLMFNYNNHNHE